MDDCTVHTDVGSASKNVWFVIHTNHPNVIMICQLSKLGWYIMSVVAYIELKSGWNHLKLDVLYAPLLDDYASSNFGWCVWSTFGWFWACL